MPDQEELIGIWEIAQMAGVTSAAVANWRKRFRDFPQPASELRSGPVFRRAQVRRWLGKRRGGVARVVALLNLKRGSGASTTAAALAEILAADFRKRVLVLDLDPQASTTVQLIGPDQWVKANGKGRTIVRLFEDALDPGKGWRKFKPDSIVMRGASSIESARNVDLIPSSLDLVEVLERWQRTPGGAFHLADPTRLLRGTLGDRLDDYDYVIIRCPPDLGLVTLNALRMATGYIVPVVPDPMSTYGLKAIVERVAAFSEEIGETIEPLGMVLNRFEGGVEAHDKLARKLRKGALKPFATVIPHGPEGIAPAGGEGLDSAQERYRDEELYRAYLNLVEELQTLLEPTSKQEDIPPQEDTSEEEQDDDD